LVISSVDTEKCSNPELGISKTAADIALETRVQRDTVGAPR